MPFPSAIDRPIFSGPDKFMQQSADKWKNRLNPPTIPILELDIPPASPALHNHNVRPLRIPVQQPPQNPVRIERPTPVPDVRPIEPLPVPPAIGVPEQISVAPQDKVSLQQDALALESQLASLAPVVKQALKVLQHPRILGGLFFIGLWTLGYFLNPETIRNVHIKVDADPEKKRTYRIILDKDKHPVAIRIGLTPGKPVGIDLHRPETKMPTVYNIVIEAPGFEKEQAHEEQIDLGGRQVVRLVDKR